MGILKLAAAVMIIGFAASPAGAAGAGKSGEVVQADARLMSTAACKYGYFKHKKSGKCVFLVCLKTHMIDKNGHKCIPKSSPKRRVYRGSH